MPAKQVSWLSWDPGYDKVCRREKQIVPSEGRAGTSELCVT